MSVPDSDVPSCSVSYVETIRMCRFDLESSHHPPCFASIESVSGLGRGLGMPVKVHGARRPKHRHGQTRGGSEIEPPLKTCPACKRTLPLDTSYWYREKNRRGGGWSGWCKACHTDGARRRKLSPKRIAELDAREAAKAQGAIRCPLCGEVKSATTEFWHRDTSSPSGFQYRCKACESVMKRERQERLNPGYLERLAAIESNRQTRTEAEAEKMHMWSGGGRSSRTSLVSSAEKAIRRLWIFTTAIRMRRTRT